MFSLQASCLLLLRWDNLLIGRYLSSAAARFLVLQGALQVCLGSCGGLGFGLNSILQCARLHDFIRFNVN